MLRIGVLEFKIIFTIDSVLFVVVSWIDIYVIRRFGNAEVTNHVHSLKPRARRQFKQVLLHSSTI